MSNSLTPDEADRLKECESKIGHSFVEIGAALAEIRDNRLYREKYGTFEEYCRRRWDQSPRHVNRIISSAKIVTKMGPIGPILPATESQARIVADLEPEVAVKVMNKANENTSGKITARAVKDARDEMVPTPARKPDPPEPDDSLDKELAELIEDEEKKSPPRVVSPPTTAHQQTTQPPVTVPIKDESKPSSPPPPPPPPPKRPTGVGKAWMRKVRAFNEAKEDAPQGEPEVIATMAGLTLQELPAVERLAKAPSEIQRWVEADQLGLGVAQTILKAHMFHDQRVQFARKLVNGHFSQTLTDVSKLLDEFSELLPRQKKVFLAAAATTAAEAEEQEPLRDKKARKAEQRATFQNTESSTRVLADEWFQEMDTQAELDHKALQQLKFVFKILQPLRDANRRFNRVVVSHLQRQLNYVWERCLVIEGIIRELGFEVDYSKRSELFGSEFESPIESTQRVKDRLQELELRLLHLTFDSDVNQVVVPRTEWDTSSPEPDDQIVSEVEAPE